MENLNLYQKVAKIKGEMSKTKLPKTGHNNYTKFDYFQLDDFEPTLEKLCSELGVLTIFDFKPDLAVMQAINTDKPEEVLTVSTPVSIQGKSGNVMQDIGAMQTYARRYLFMSFFGITESDSLDAVLGKDESENKPNKQPAVSQNKPQPQTQAQPDNKSKEIWKAVLLACGYDTKKAKENADNVKALSNAKDLLSSRYGKDSINSLSPQQLDDLDKYISSTGPENFISDEIPA